MAYTIAAATIARTIWCEKEFACLQNGSCETCAQCEIVGENAINALFLRNRKSSGCPYYFDFGSACLCTCPTRYAIYKQHGS
ncbi:MAG: hypothetical protein ACTS6J_08235 [Burkholderiales bacterium]